MFNKKYNFSQAVVKNDRLVELNPHFIIMRSQTGRPVAKDPLAVIAMRKRVARARVVEKSFQSPSGPCRVPHHCPHN